jgi:serine/threonine protein kinase/class 3 adenylate cyclase
VTERAGKRVANPPTGTITFLFTDIEGSTAMWERDPARMQAALARHDEILRTTVESNGGYVFKTIGDAFCAAFITARHALEATLAAQRALFAEEWNESTTVRVRMALHTGATEERDGDYFGPPVNRVARLLSAGHGGQVLLSGVTYGLVRDILGSLEAGAELKDLGEHHLKDLKYSEHIYQLVVPDLPSRFPSLKTLDTRSNERYGLTKLIGGGGMAEVYLARDRELDRDVALKLLKHQYAEDEQFVERFDREAKNAASLSHPNIVAVYDRGKTRDGAYYIVMEHVAGGTLKGRILEKGPLPAPEAGTMALQVARALRLAHERGVIHRDIKPQNILLTESGEAKVADFGIARAASSTAMTQEGLIPGTPHYISPEQALGDPATPQSDLYSLGVVLYEMLTGRVPHDAETPIGIAMKHIAGQAYPPKEANPQVPEDLDAVTMQLLARKPEDRYRNADELIEDLEQVIQGHPPSFAGAQRQDASTSEDSPPYASSTGEAGGSSSTAVPSLPREPVGAPPDPPPPVRPGGGDAGDGQPRPWRAPSWAMAAAGILVVAALGLGIVLMWQGLSGGEDENAANVPDSGGSPLEQSSTPGYALAKDNSGKLSVEVPSDWSDVDGTPWDFRGGKIGLSLIATNDLDTWYYHNYYRNTSEGIDTPIDEAPGVLFAVSESLPDKYPDTTEDQVLNLREFSYTGACEYDDRYEYDDGTYKGKYDHWINCGEANANIFVLAALPEDQSHVAVIQVTAGSEEDLEAQKHILDTFKVADDL